MMTKGRVNAGNPSGESRLVAYVFDFGDLPLGLSCAVFILFWSFKLSSPSFTMPHAARRRGSDAPMEVDTITSASRNARAAAMFDALIEALTAAVANPRKCSSRILLPFPSLRRFSTPFPLEDRDVKLDVAFTAFSKAFWASGSRSIAASNVYAQRCSDTLDALPTLTTFKPTFIIWSAKLSAPTLLNAQARTFEFKERLRH
mmetsp:Transcript_32305/g.39323  ORF Transcript_32305/g.39323 Transcript_32305/m.39323 type:complete len:202 (+) Transcript_32305:148-753(+)